MVAKEVQQSRQGSQNDNNELSTPVKKTPVKNKGKSNEVVKSPSDMTIYAPALAKLSSPLREQVIGSKPNNVQHNTQPRFSVDNVARFIEDIRMEHAIEKGGAGSRVSEDEAGPSKKRKPTDDDYEEARKKAEKVVLEVEQFRATINVPQGMTVNDNEFFAEDVKDDDKFFHITCHVDPGLVGKISRGEFVDLHKLLPKQKQYSALSEPKTELIFKERRPVFVLHVDRNRTVNGIRKWEQAFRVYAAIFSQANPHRSAEIWQYVFTINSAASSYSWNNVAEYDYAFRQMMGRNPKRSWSKIYTQMWNISLTDPVHFRNNGNKFTTQNGRQGSHPTQGSHKSGGGNKPDYC